jgi:two-component system NtrC family sensor kinase
MRLVISLLLASLSSSVTVLLIYAWISVADHRQSWLDDMKADHLAMVGMLIEAMEVVAERHGVQQASDLVADVNARKDNVHLEWLGAVDGAETSDAGITQTSITEDEARGEPRLETRAAVAIGGRPAGTLLLVESSSRTERLIDARTRRLTITGLLMLVSGTAVGGLAGVFLVAGRVRAMVSQARRVAAGELDRRIEHLGPDDELAELGRELNAMTERLGEARAQLLEQTEAKLRALDQLRHGERLITVGKLAAGFAHELGTPLNVVTVSAKMIADGEAIGDEVPEYARIIAEQGQRMSKILGELMAFARRRAPERVDTDVRELVDTTCKLLTPLAARRGVALRVTGSERVDARIDPGQIQQVVTNLVVNAVHASPAGAEVGVHVEGSGGWLSIEVRDHGDGIPPEHREHVFEPFFTTKDVGTGTGLGLSVAYGLVTEHGGEIGVESDAVTGTVFHVRLPTLGERDAAIGEQRPT